MGAPARPHQPAGSTPAYDTRPGYGGPRELVRSRRLELPRGFPHSDLNAARLPIPPRPRISLRQRKWLPLHGRGNSKSTGGDQAPAWNAERNDRGEGPGPTDRAGGHPPGNGGLADQRGSPGLRRCGRLHGTPRPGHPRRPGAGDRVAARTPAAVHGRHQRPPGRVAGPRPLPRVPHRPRRPLHLSRPRPAGGLCDARSDDAGKRRARLRPWPGGMAHRHPGPLRRPRRAPAGAGRHLGRPRRGATGGCPPRH